MKKQIITMGAVGLAVAGSAVSAKADETAGSDKSRHRTVRC